VYLNRPAWWSVLVAPLLVLACLPEIVRQWSRPTPLGQCEADVKHAERGRA
jgi:hypothetical protein